MTDTNKIINTSEHSLYLEFVMLLGHIVDDF
jgi:hypothetical protein